MKDATWAASGIDVLFYALSGNNTGNDWAGLLQTPPMHGLEAHLSEMSTVLSRMPSSPCIPRRELPIVWDRGKVWHIFSASSDDVTLAFTAFLPGKSKATGLEMIFPSSNMQPESNVLHFWLLANNLPPHCPHPRPSLSVTHAGSICSTRRT